MNEDLTPLLVAMAIGVPIVLVAVLMLGRAESWRERRRDARRRRRRPPVRR